MKYRAVFRDGALDSIDVCLACYTRDFKADKRTKDGMVLCEKCRRHGFYMKSFTLKHRNFSIETTVPVLIDRISRR